MLVLTELWHYSELQAGLAMTPGAIAASVSAVIAGRRATPRAAVAAGAALMAALGLFIAATLTTHPHFLTYWLPIGLVLGAGMGMVTTGTSTAAALSVPPQSFAAGTGLNQTARQVGGALGVATLATLLRSGAAGQAATFTHVYVFCSAAAVGAGPVGLALVLRPATQATQATQAAPATQATPAAEPAGPPVAPAAAG